MNPTKGNSRNTGADNNDDNRANQLNPNHEEYRGSTNEDTGNHNYDNDNHSNQLNPNHEEYKGS